MLDKRWGLWYNAKSAIGCTFLKGELYLKKITIYELARELNMTPSMVSRALSPNGKVRADKRELVLQAAKKHGFVPNSFASRLSMKSIRIGIIIRTLFHVNCEKMIAAIKSAYNEICDYKIEYDIKLIDAHNERLEETQQTILSYADHDGLIVAGLSAEKYSPALNAFYEKNKNLVQVQAVNENLPCLFSSKHDEKTAAEMAAEFLSSCLKRSEQKNILLLTGDLNSALHKSAAEAFASACKKRGLCLVESFDMHDSEELLASTIGQIFDRHGEKIDGIYTTSGISAPLCEYLEKNGLSPFVVAFDTHSAIREYLKKGIVTATISQDVTGQMKNAFRALILYIVKGETMPKIIFSDIRLVLQSNSYLFD